MNKKEISTTPFTLIGFVIAAIFYTLAYFGMYSMAKVFIVFFFLNVTVMFINECLNRVQGREA